MCGISGIIAKRNNQVDRQQLKIMNDAVTHRGPDGEGFYMDGKIGFGHRRLAIIDLSDLGKQPMSYGDDLWITYNGEVFNYLELRQELAQKGYTFKSDTDTEVVLAAYEEWGEECTHRFNGMWAFAIHDRKRNIVFISRDRFGVKPFHYYENDHLFLFSSEIRQLLTQVDSRRVNRQILFDYLFLGYHHHTSETFYEGVRSLAPGHNLIFDLSSSTFKVYQWYRFEPKPEITRLSSEALQELFESTIEQAITLRLRSDVRVGTCLSGGLDSSFVAAVAAENFDNKAGEKFSAITARSIDPNNDESQFARMVVERAGLQWHITHPHQEDFRAVLNDVIGTQEEPFGGPSVMMQYFVMQKARETGCVVLLDGQGADEALLGYDRYFAAYLAQQKGILNKARSFRSISKNSGLNGLNLLLYSIYFRQSRVRGFRQLSRSKFVHRQYKSYFNSGLLDEIAAASESMETLQKHEITKVQLQKLLKYEDRNSMRFSIEARVPFVDYRVMELGLSIPFEFKVYNGWSKYVLRKAVEKRLPAEIAWRKRKIGFEAPPNWYGSKDNILSEIGESCFLKEFVDVNRVDRNIDNDTLWRLYNLALWARKFRVEF